MVEQYSDCDFETLLAKYDYNFKRGDIVKGIVCAYEADGAIVDIGSKSTAFVPAYEVSSDRKAKVEDVLELNTEYEFLITQECDENGKFTLSYKKVHLAHTWAELEKVKEADETIAVVVSQMVTGGAGFIGSCFVRHILNKYPDYKLINIDALTYCGNLENLKDVENNPNYTFIHGNICDRKLVRELVSQVNCIVNFAAESHVDNSIKHPEIFIETNVQGTLNLLQAAKEIGIERYLQVSTDEVYGTLGKTGYF